MNITDAKQLVGQKCEISWSGRGGLVQETVSMVYDVSYVKLYGGYLVTDVEDIRLDKLMLVSTIADCGAKSRVFELLHDSAREAA